MKFKKIPEGAIDDIVCPWCRRVVDVDAWEYLFAPEGEWETKCDSCPKTFYTRGHNVKVFISTREKS